MAAQSLTLTPISPALAEYFARNPESASRLAGMKPEHAAAALKRLERWISRSQPTTTEPLRSNLFQNGV